jgi:hypothetical protein
MQGKRIYFTAREISVVRDVLQTITAYTGDELVEQFDWSDADITAWGRSLTKFTRADSKLIGHTPECQSAFSDRPCDCGGVWR